MRIGLFYQIQVPKPWTAESEAQRIYEALEQIPYAEEQGFDSVWFSEHHFRRYGRITALLTSPWRR
jgi:alkanesulfonate monooxygenase SsuD/methylene tetrahydromethanopterin reductase-like flavin-dependent oxidoreductase (luciferase family)